MTTTDSIVVRTLCPMNCHPTLCGMRAEVRGGRLVGLKGDPENRDSRGFLCVRGQATRGIFDNPLRQTQPLMRDTRGGELRPASWNEAMDRSIHTLLLPGSNMLSSFVDTHALADGLQRTKLVVSHDLFLNETARRLADVVLPATAWLEELGCKMTSTHLSLREPAMAPEGQARSLRQLLQGLAEQLGVEGFFPWRDDEALVDEVLNHPSTGPATVASLRQQGGIGELKISPVDHATLQVDTPSRRIEFFSQKALDPGLPPPPVPDAPAVDPYPLALAQGRTLVHFHAFYDGGRALPSLARRERKPQLWLSPANAAARGAAIRVFNQRGSMSARAHVTPRMADGAAVLPDHAADAFPFAAGQSRYGARVEVEAVAA